MCILQSHKNVNIWGLPLRFDIANYLIPMWHVCSNKFQFSFVVTLWFLFVWLCLVWFFSYMHSIYFVRNHLFHLILTMALPVGSNSWNYQCFLLWSWSWSSFLYTTERYLYVLLVLTSDTSNCGGLCRPSSHWLLR